MTTPDNENMVERVARALHRHDADKNRDFDWFGYRKIMYGDGPALWEHLHEDAKEVFRQAARAAIAAMREPDFSMKLAADLFFDNTSRVFGLAEPGAAGKKIWQAMIDAALNGK